MPQIVEMVESDSEFESLKATTVMEALAAADAKQPANFNLNSFEVVVPPNEQDRPIIFHTKMEVRPDYHAVPGFRIRPISIDRFENLEGVLNGIRIQETSSPFVPGHVEYPRPEGNVLYTHDRYVFTPELQNMLRGTTMDLELIAADIADTNTVEKAALPAGLQNGIEGLKGMKSTFMTDMVNFRNQASHILNELTGSPPPPDMFVGRSAEDIYNTLDAAIDGGTLWGGLTMVAHLGTAKALDIRTKMYVLFNELSGLTNDLAQTAVVGNQTYTETLAPVNGFHLPASVGGVQGAVARFGIGTPSYLHLL